MGNNFFVRGIYRWGVTTLHEGQKKTDEEYKPTLQWRHMSHMVYRITDYIDGLMQDSSNLSTVAMG